MPGQPPDPPLQPDGDASAAFGDDVRLTLGVWRQQPALPLLTTFFAILAAWASSRWTGHAIAALAALVFGGWVGSERLWYLRAFTGRRLTARAAVRASLSYFGRFACVALWVSLVTTPAYLLVLLVEHAQGHKLADAQGQPSRSSLVALAALSLAVDLALTFVSPAVVFTTRRARSAIGIGFRLLRRTWPHSAAYVLLPPLAVLLLTRFSSGPVGVFGAVLILASSLLNLLAKGATAAYYLRLMPTSGPDGDFGRSAPTHPLPEAVPRPARSSTDMAPAGRPRPPVRTWEPGQRQRIMLVIVPLYGAIALAAAWIALTVR